MGARPLRERVPSDRIRDEGRLFAGFVRAGLRSYIIIVALAIITGMVLMPAAIDVASGPDGSIAVIPVDGTIDGQSATEIGDMLEEAREDDDIEAVTLVINSGGGTAVASEELYMEIQATADEMPVVSVVQSSAASGAYMLAAPSDQLYVKPSSMVGSIGVLVQIAEDPGPTEGLITTGPDKIRAQDERGWMYQLDALQNSFLEIVESHRGDALELTREELAQAKIYVGLEAVNYGLADDIATLDDGVEQAAEMADLEDYDTHVMNRTDEVSFLTRSTYVASNAANKSMVDPTYFGMDPSEGELANFWMIPQDVIPDAAIGNETAEVDP